MDLVILAGRGRFGARELSKVRWRQHVDAGVQHTLRPFERSLSVPRLGMSFPQYLSMFRLNRGKRRHGFAQIVRGGLGLILDEGICVEKAHAIIQVSAGAGIG